MGLEDKSVPNLTVGYSALLGQNLWLQENQGWKDYLLSVADTLAAIAILVGNNAGSFSVMESSMPEQRWLWLDPDAVKHLDRQGYTILKSAVDVSTMDVESAYKDILVTLGRNPMGRRVR